MLAYLDVLVHRLESLLFVSGESLLKLDTLHRLGNLLTECRFSSFEVSLSSRAVGILRVFLVDWDRSVRSLCFRVCRVGLPFMREEDMLLKSIDVFTVVRLESSKSHVERVAIIRFMSDWMRITTSSLLVSLFLKAVNELIFGHLPKDMSHFVIALSDLSMSIQSRFPHISVFGLKGFFEAVYPNINDRGKNQLMHLTNYICTSSDSIISISEKLVLVPSILKKIVASTVGLAILAASATFESVSNLPDDCLEISDLSNNHSKMMTLSDVRDSMSLILRNKSEYQSLVTYPIPEIFVSGRHLTTQNQTILAEIINLGSLVQWKTKSHALSSRRMRNPSNFESVELWYVVQDRVRHGNFNLQTKRFVHGLFVHLFCDSKSFQELDILVVN